MKNIDKRAFWDAYEVVFGTGNREIPAVVYYPERQELEHIGLYVKGNGTIEINHLPRSGYSFSSYEPGEYGEKFVIVKGGIYPYWEALFLDENEYYMVLFVKTGEVREAKVTVVPNGVGASFCLEYKDDDKKEYFSREVYDDQFVVVKGVATKDKED